MTQYFNFNDTVINVNDIIARYEDIEDMLDDTSAAGPGDPDREEAMELKNILAELCDKSDYEPWRDGWYPEKLIAADYFKNYAQELGENMAAFKKAQWPLTCINWDQAADELQQNYLIIQIRDKKFFYL